MGVTILCLLTMVLIYFDGHIFLPKYFYLKCNGIKLNATASKLKSSRGSFAPIPLLDYSCNGVEYTGIEPLHASSSASKEFKIGQNIRIIIDQKNPEICVIDSDFVVAKHLIIGIIFYIFAIYGIIVNS
jgi:hypothetical protein